MHGANRSHLTHWSLAVPLVLALACAFGPAIAAGGGRSVSEADAVSGAALVPWLPSESHPDGPRYDPRLDRPVQFWRAGLSLAEVFGGIAEQAGVEIGFWPPGDENERVRVNLYLSAEDAPTLRDLMSQVSWVTDCIFACEGTGSDAEPYRYYLLSTSIAAGVEARLAQDWEAAMASVREEWESRAPARDEIEDRLAEYESALAMPTDELIGRYHGVDDRLLATMLDPARRAAASFTVSLAEESREALLDGDLLTLEWQDLTEQQQGELRSCLSSRGPWGGGGRGRRGRPGGPPGDPGWEGEVTQVNVGGLRYGQMMLSAETERAGEESRRRRGRFLWGPWLNLTGEGELTPDERVALRRGLGESVTEDEERSMFREWMESLRDDWNQQWEERARQAAEAAIDEQPDLSPSVESVLSSFILPVDDGVSYALWQVQEAVASASGMHICSDSFYQPARNLTRGLGVLHPGQTVEMTGLTALRVSCLSTEDVSTLVWSARGDHRAGWEWGDAGRFLRFRSKGRDLWRAGMLPPEASEGLDSRLAPYVPTPDAPERLATGLEVPLDLREISALAVSLGNLQLEHGGKLICGDPTDRASAYRQALREEVLGAVWRTAGTLRALATFSDGQWEQVREAGLRVAYDLTPDQKRALGLSVEREQGGPEGARGPGRRGGGPGAGGRGGRGGVFDGRGLGGPGRWGVRVEDEGEMARLVMRLTDEPPWGGRRGRGPGGGGERGRTGDREGRGDREARGDRRGRGGEGRPGRGEGGGPGPWGRRPVESDYLVLSVDGDIRGAYPMPRVVSVDVSLPSPLGPAVPIETR